MQQADKPRMAAVLKGLAAIKPGVKLTDESYEIYWLCLERWPFEDFKRAAVHLASQSEFMPNPYHFEQLRKAGRPTPGEAWIKVLVHVRANAYRGGGVVVDDLTDRAVASIGGYHAIGMCEADKTHFLATRFGEAYDAIQDAEDVREALPQIAAPVARAKLSGATSTKGLIGNLRIERPQTEDVPQ